jgi:transcriptional regulator with XRE-family HTH domain
MGGKAGDTMGARLKELRHRAGLTQQALAFKSGLSMSLVTALEYNVRDNPTLSTLLALCKAMDCTLDELAGGLEVKPEPEPKKKPKR